MTETGRARQGEKTMLKNILVTVFISGAILMGTMGTARALLSSPNVVYKGTAINAAIGNSVTIAITVNGVTTTVATCTVAADRSYELRVPMDSVDPRTSGTAHNGDTAAISIEGVLVKTVTIPQFGTVVLLDLGARTAEQWATDHPGDDGSGDMNRNGISDLDEYLNGNDPAGCVWNPIDSVNAETTVYHGEVLKNCLKDAGSDGRHNLIRLARGTYAGNFSYTSAWGEAYDLTLTGGYDPAGSGSRLPDPAQTVLTGDTDSDGIGNGIVLVVDTDTNKTSGKVHIESITFKNGNAPAGQYGGGIQARIYRGDLELAGNIISNNSTDSASDNTAGSGGGLSLESSDSGQIFLVNNLIYGNSAANAAAGRIVTTTGPITILNNTMADNAATSDGDGRSLLVKSTAAAVDMTNNIIDGVAGVSGSNIFVNSSGVTIPLSITHNDFPGVDSLLVNTPGFASDVSNIVNAPLFEAQLTGNYRLAATSPCINSGIAHGKLPDKDIIGAWRIADGAPDIGAYEYLDPAKPVINTFTAVPRVNYLIADTTISASDDVAVTGYCLTEASDSTGCSWSATAPVSYTFATAGVKTLYAFARDADNNIGMAKAGSISVSIPALTVAVVANGATGTSGTVTSSPAGISCTSSTSGTAVTCSNTFSGTVNLYATPSAMTIFGGWGGACDGLGGCSVTMDGPKTVTAAFNPAPLLHVDGTTYKTLQEVYNAAFEGAVIQLLDNTVAGTLDANRNVTVRLKGGYDASYTTTTGTTVVTGPLTIKQGKIVADKIVVK